MKGKEKKKARERKREGEGEGKRENGKERKGKETEKEKGKEKERKGKGTTVRVAKHSGRLRTAYSIFSRERVVAVLVAVLYTNLKVIQFLRGISGTFEQESHFK